jgi:hypothetical protein
MGGKIKGGTGRVEHVPGPPKTTSQGQGQHSRPRRQGKKKMRGQGR